MQNQDRWLTPDELELTYGFSKSWQSKNRMISNKSKLPFYKLGRFIRYKQSEIDAYIEEHKFQ